MARKEFILVDAEHGTRRPAFDHPKLAAALSKAAGASLTRPTAAFREIEFVDDANASALIRRGDLELQTGYVRMHEGRGRAANKVGEPSEPRGGGTPRRAVAGVDSARVQASLIEGLRSPDGKWTAFVKDHNVFVRAEGKTEDVHLSTDGKEGLAYGRLSWSPDSKALVAFRVEPGERKEVYLVQSSPPGGGRAKLSTRPYPLPGDKFAATS